MVKVLKSTYKILTPINGAEVMKHIESCARTCYQSFDKIKEGSADRLVKHIVERHHESCLEHFSVSVRIITDRGIQNELVRHRLSSFSVESTRYCQYADEISVIRPIEIKEGSVAESCWIDCLKRIEKTYKQMLKIGEKPENARSVLPLCLKTEMVITANLREWQHIFKMRCDKAAHPDVRDLMCRIKSEFEKELPIIFGEKE